MSDPNFKAFAKILCFMKELRECFGVEFPSVVKYYSLCKKTNISNVEAIHRHVQIVGDFCLLNAAAIKSGEVNTLTPDLIYFNDKINFSLLEVVNKTTDQNIKQAIANHLKLILCLIHPDEELKNALVAASTSASTTTKEEDLFANLLGKMENKYGNNKEVGNVSDALSDMQSSGFMQDITKTVTSGLESGELDVNNLVKGAFGMFNKIKAESNDPQIAGMMSMVESMLGQLKR
jgi:hypothetical protein